MGNFYSVGTCAISLRYNTEVKFSSVGECIFTPLVRTRCLHPVCDRLRRREGDLNYCLRKGFLKKSRTSVFRKKVTRSKMRTSMLIPDLPFFYCKYKYTHFSLMLFSYFIAFNAPLFCNVFSIRFFLALLCPIYLFFLCSLRLVVLHLVELNNQNRSKKKGKETIYKMSRIIYGEVDSGNI